MIKFSTHDESFSLIFFLKNVRALEYEANCLRSIHNSDDLKRCTMWTDNMLWPGGLQGSSFLCIYTGLFE